MNYQIEWSDNFGVIFAGERLLDIAGTVEYTGHSGMFVVKLNKLWDTPQWKVRFLDRVSMKYFLKEQLS